MCAGLVVSLVARATKFEPPILHMHELLDIIAVPFAHVHYFTRPVSFLSKHFL
jgi:hypothetical protein